MIFVFVSVFLCGLFFFVLFCFVFILVDFEFGCLEECTSLFSSGGEFFMEFLSPQIDIDIKIWCL